MKTQKTIQYKIVKPNKNKLLKLNTTMRQYRKCINFYLHQIVKGEKLKNIYEQAKKHYNLPTALIQTARDIAKEQYESYKNNEDNKQFPHFSGFVTMRMDKRTINFSKENNHFDYWVNISTIKGKIKVPIIGRDVEKLSEDFKSVQVTYKNNGFYLNVVFEEEHNIPKEEDFEHFVGVDLGINNIATITVQNRKGEILETKFFSGRQLMEKRRRFEKLKSKLQSKKVWNKLKQIKGKERRYMKDLNHKISSKIISIAKKYDDCVIIMEKLKGIRKKIKYSKEFNKKFHKWAFAEMQEFIMYKAHEVNTVVRRVYPAFTSQVCTNCLSQTRSSGQQEVCEKCMKLVNHDWLGSVNISRKLFDYMSDNLGCSESNPEQSNNEYEGVTEPPFGIRKGIVAQLSVS